VSEPKENEPGAEKPDTAAEAPNEAATEAISESTEAEAEGAGEAAEGAAAAEGDARVEKKKKKKRDAEGEPETIKDRNARVRAEAAEKRRSRREREQASAPRRNLDASEVMDDALARSTHAAAGFLKSHFNKLQWVIVGGLAVWIGWEVYSWRHARQAEKSSQALFKALTAEMGKVGDGEGANDADPAEDTRRSFKTDDERLNAAKKEYLLASGSTTAASVVLADLGAAGVAYDLGQYKEAQAAYEKVKQHPAFGTDNDIRGRTLEGLGMTLEALKNDDGALKQFRELASMDSANFAALGMYHQARLLKSQGKNEDALKLLEKAGEKLVLLKDTPGAIRYLRVSVMELYQALDPKKAGELQQKLMPADILKQLQEQMGAVNAAKAGLPADALPVPALPPGDAPEQAPEAPVEQAPAPGPLRDPEPAPAPAGSP
jgi:hypothetical protein